ncbi:hypothetical protein [Halorhabdus rudnickae]|uniref:hypothetical protein n=1 Tax=Halorhabdus rudnickae TaxID=1775544 RepID=UPI001FCEF41A|nr:hypothetical protein [Halorhabdus rudnickae]
MELDAEFFLEFSDDGVTTVFTTFDATAEQPVEDIPRIRVVTFRNENVVTSLNDPKRNRSNLAPGHTSCCLGMVLSVAKAQNNPLIS